MNKQKILNLCALVFSSGVFIFISVYGPMKRVYVSPQKALSASSGSDILHLWETTGVKGRIALCFTRYLNAFENKESGDIKVIEEAINKGIVRTVFHIVPDSAWAEVSQNLSRMPAVKAESNGFIALFGNARVYVFPISHFRPPAETALVVIEPKVWADNELSGLAKRIRKREITTDLLVVIRGTPDDLKLLRSSVIATGGRNRSPD